MPVVQSFLARVAVEKLNSKFKTDIHIQGIAIDILGNITLKGLTATDNHGLDFISIERLSTSVADFQALKQGKIFLGNSKVQKLFLNIHKYENDTISNIDALISAFDNGQPGDGSFRLKAKSIAIEDGHFIVSDDNSLQNVAVDFRELNGKVTDFRIEGPNIYGFIEQGRFADNWGMNVVEMQGDFGLTKTSISVGQMVLRTDKSYIKGDLLFSFEPGDMKYFVDKVNWHFDIEKANINTSDINVFANEFAENKMLYVSGLIQGPMNNFILENARAIDQNNSQIQGHFAFKNVFDPAAPFWMQAKLDRLQTTRGHLISLMPKTMLALLPEQLNYLGHVDLRGDIILTKRTLESDVQILTSIGKANAKLDIVNLNDPYNAQYNGDIILNSFDLGEFLQQSQLGLTSLDLYVDGMGFNQESLNTNIKGDIFSLDFGAYRYTQIAVDGTMKMPNYLGLVHISDPNLMMDFNGTVDLSSTVKNYDFVADVDYANLYALGLVNDSISKFKGDFSLKASGNTIDDLQGEFRVNSALYNNSKDNYVFEDFSVKSHFNDTHERSISIESSQAIQGYIIGRYNFKDLKALFTNALGSLYTNYSPYPIEKGQYIDFDISVHNSLIEVFLPQLTVEQKSHFEGVINNDLKQFKLKFNSPNFALHGISFFNANLNVNNNNPLYNTFISIDSVKNNSYKISDFNLLNLTHNDTLFVRSEFKGGKHNKDDYSLNLYHTINDQNLSVVGFKKSEVIFKDYLWTINATQDTLNKVVFNKSLTDFSIEKVVFSHLDQMVDFSGVMRDSTYKHLDLAFNNVDLEKITPDIENIAFGGQIDGEFHFSQAKELYHPSVNLKIDSLSINKVHLGNMIFHVDGNQSLENFKVDANITDQDTQRFYLNGDINLVNKKTYFNLESGFNDFTLKPIGPLLSTVLSNMRGQASGKISILGTPLKPEVNGRLYLNQAGMTSKFTGVDYVFEPNTPLDITEKQFIFRKARISDTKYKTQGIVEGDVSHRMFKDWELNLSLSSANLLALDTQFEEGSLYYGTAFINGMASLRGPVNMLAININATSNKDTYIKIPLKEAQNNGENNYIHFLSPAEKQRRLKGENTDIYRYQNSGIELDFEFVITPDAEIEIILDRESGHAMKGRGAGFITMEINTLGKFNMWGDFQAYEGEYNFKYGGLIDKKFVVKKYGTIRWDGDPMNAILDLQAIYHTEANPSVIVDNSIINRKVPTDVAIVLNGSLSNPEVDFEINFPTVSSVVKSELDYRLSDRDMRERQAMALLATGSFFSSDNSSTALAGSLFERASSIFDDLFSDEDDKFKVGLNYAQGERNPYTQTEGRLGVTFSTKVNDRITVNGKLGVPVGGEEQSVIVGDVEVLLRLTQEGNLNARFFNRENDINYIGEGIGYTQGVGLTYEVDFDTFKELLAKILKQADQRAKKKQKEQDKSDLDRSEELPDSDFSRDFIKFYEDRNKTRSSSK
ncbi:translocation/assembly module TamB domain-containing protein [Myroides sp. LJL119]